MSGDVIDEAELVEGLRRGDDAAFEQLVRTYGGRLLQVARRFLREEDARDALQEAFLSAFKAIHRFDGKAKISTWLHRIVVNSALMRLRKKSSKMEESLEPLLPKFLEDGHQAHPSAAWPENPEEAVGREQMRDVVRQAIDQLPEGYRNVVLLRDIEELSGAETGELLGLTPNAVKVRLHRARRALREILDPQIREVTA
ncbi:MAG: sigma-70 family RNA polymerase sigma factor [bacterium]|nr:sigma-70 family RNA polymerase sigma factor [bacterium]